MEYIAFSLLDTKTGIHHPPFYVAHIGIAIRTVKDVASDLGTSIGRHPADYMLVRLGTFDDANGVTNNSYEPIASVVHLMDKPATTLFSSQEA